MRIVYRIAEERSFQEGVRVFSVAKYPRGTQLLPQIGQPVSVWHRPGSYTRCTGCQSILRGMSGSCPHAKAVKRYLEAK
jgi:hypothetical protein